MSPKLCSDFDNGDTKTKIKIGNEQKVGKYGHFAYITHHMLTRENVYNFMLFSPYMYAQVYVCSYTHVGNYKYLHLNTLHVQTNRNISI